MLPPLRYGALSGDSRLTSDVCLSVAQIRPKSRTEAYRKTKIGTKVHVTGTPLSRSKGQRSTCMRRGNIVAPPAQLVLDVSTDTLDMRGRCLLPVNTGIRLF